MALTFSRPTNENVAYEIASISTDDIDLSGGSTTFSVGGVSRSHAAIVAGDDGSKLAFHIQSTTTDKWEVASGSYTDGTTTLARTTIHESSTGSKVDFGAETVRLWFVETVAERDELVTEVEAKAVSGGAEHDGFSDFVADEHVAHTGVTLTAGAGLTGGGDISAGRSFAVGAGTGITVNADDVALSAGSQASLALADTAVQPSTSPQLTTIELGHATDTTIARVSAGVISVEGTQVVLAGGAFHDGFSDFVADEHVDHSGVSLSAGAGIASAGLGDLTASRTIAVDGVLEDLDTLGAAASDGQFIVATGAGAFAYETDAAARTSMGAAASTVTQGQHTLWVPAAAMVPRTTSGADAGTAETTGNSVMLDYLGFDTAADEFAQFQVQMPKSWNESTLVCQFIWSHDATVTNFGVSWWIQAGAFADGDAADTAFGTAVEAEDTGGTTDDIYISPETSAMTVAGTPGAEEYVIFQVYRDVSDTNDDLAVDARLHGVKVHYTTDTDTDD